MIEVKKFIQKIEKSKFLQNSSWIIAEKICQMLLTLFVNRIVAQYLQPENYGTLNYGTSIVTFFVSICTLGIDSIIVKEILQHKDKQGEIMGTSIVLRMISSILSVILIIIVVSILKPGNKEILIITVVQSIALFFETINIIQFWYQSRLKSKNVVIIAFIAYSIVAIYKVGLVLLRKGLVWFAFANSLNAILIAIFTFSLYKIQKGPKLSFKKDLIKPLLSQSYHFILSGLMVAIYGQTDKMMIGSMCGNMAEVGYYSVATTITNLWSFIPSAIITSMRPIIIEAKEKDETLYLKRLKQLYAIVLWINFLYAIGVTIFANLIINILYGAEYLPAKVSLLLAVWSGGFSYVGVARDTWFVLEGYQKYSKWICLMGAVTNVILNLIFIPIMGINGAALATTITQIMTGLISTLLFKDTRVNTKYVLQGMLFKF